MFKHNFSDEIDDVLNDIIYDIDEESIQNEQENKSYDSFADITFFFPIADKLVDPLKKIKLTPNNITCISTVFTFLSIYFLNINNHYYATMSYIFGYILDCVDGKLARKYNMTSDYGMMLDAVSDTVSNLSIIIFLINKYSIDNKYIYMILFMSFMLTIYNGMTEAIKSYETTGIDNFYEKKLNEIKSEDDIVYHLYMYMMKIMYKTYKIFFPNYNRERMDKILSYIKEFGPGNYCLFFSSILMIIK